MHVTAVLLWIILVVPLAITLKHTSNTSATAEKTPSAPSVGSETITQTTTFTTTRKNLGIYDYGQNTIDQQVTDLHPSILAWFERWNITSYGKLNYACSNGFTPLVTWESWDGQNGATNPYGLSDIAAGKYDSLITRYADAVNSTCHNSTVLVRFDHEMELQAGYTAWYPWQGYPTDYVAAYRHVVTLFRQHDPAVKFIWSPNRYTDITKTYYPGSDFVDFVSMTLNMPVETTRFPGGPTELYAATSSIENYGKPIIISEIAVDRTDQATKQQWIKEAYSLLENNNKIVGMVWFNSQEGLTDYRVNATPAIYETYKEQSAILLSENKK